MTLGARWQRRARQRRQRRQHWQVRLAGPLAVWGGTPQTGPWIGTGLAHVQVWAGRLGAWGLRGVNARTIDAWHRQRVAAEGPSRWPHPRVWDAAESGRPMDALLSSRHDHLVIAQALTRLLRTREPLTKGTVRRVGRRLAACAAWPSLADPHGRWPAANDQAGARGRAWTSGGHLPATHPLGAGTPESGTPGNAAPSLMEVVNSRRMIGMAHRLLGEPATYAVLREDPVTGPIVRAAVTRDAATGLTLAWHLWRAAGGGAEQREGRAPGATSDRVVGAQRREALARFLLWPEIDAGRQWIFAQNAQSTDDLPPPTAAVSEAVILAGLASDIPSVRAWALTHLTHMAPALAAPSISPPAPGAPGAVKSMGPR